MHVVLIHKNGAGWQINVLYIKRKLKNLYMFWTSLNPSSGGTETVFIHFVLVIQYS